MEAVWWRIERWLNDQAPYVLASLQAGATIADIAETEALLGVRLPEDVRVSYQLHNGQVTNGIGFIEERELLSLQGIRQEWQVWKDLLDGGEFDDRWSTPVGPILTTWWSPKWIPLTANGCGDAHCVDLSPAMGGTVGQIITMRHDDTERTLIASSFAGWFETFATDLEMGRYRYSERDHSLVKHQ